MFTDTSMGSDEKKRERRFKSLVRMKEIEEKKLL